MKKIIIIFLFPLFIFSHNLENYYWYTFSEIMDNFDKLRPYDIVVLNKGKEIYQKWGHVFLIDKDKMFLEFKGYDEYFVSSPFFSFLGTDRKFSVLRYKNISVDIENEIERLIPKYYNKEYSIFVSNNIESHYTYCSKFILDIFDEALNNNDIKESKLFEDNYWPIYPFDFFESKYLENIKLK